MCRWYSGLAILFLLWPAGLAGQDSEFSRFELYGGYAHWTSGRMKPRGLSGFGLALSYAPKPWVRWVFVDAGGSFGSTPFTHDLGQSPVVSPAAVHQENLQVLTGPEFTKRTPRFTIFMHALLGYYIWSTTYQRGALNDERGLAAGTGGGVDINVSRFLALRAIGLDYIPSRISQGGSQTVAGDLPVPSSAQATWYNNLRVSFGLILKRDPR